MDRPELRISFSDAEALSREFDGNLRLGRAFSPEPADLEVLSDCTLVLVHPSNESELALPAQIVMVSDTESLRGVGLELRPFDAGVRERIAAWIAGAPEAPSPRPTGPTETPTETPAGPTTDAIEDERAGEAPAETVIAESSESAGPAPEAPGATANETDIEAAAEAETDDAQRDDDDAGDDGFEIDPLPDEDEDDDSQGDDGGEVEDRQQQEALMDRMRGLSATERHRIARRGELHERIILERLYEREVWALLLRNPRITVPEVARIARKRSVPRPLLEQIVENRSWTQAALVRRALLGNPRVGMDMAAKLIRNTPKHELKMIAVGTSYSIGVRDLAKKALTPKT